MASSQAPDTDNRVVSFSWPNGARAAVSLTYDDSMPSHYEVAAPQLGQAGLRGTFFLNHVELDAPWVVLAERGHELGAHTQTHPCPRSTGASDRPSEEFTVDDLVFELDQDLLQLQRLGQKPPFSFAYPCGVTWVGAQESYVPFVRERFLAGRIASPETTWPGLDLHLVPARFDLPSTRELMAAVDSATLEGRWLVLGFHGIGAGWLVTEAEVHAEFTLQLARREDVWVAPFGEIAAYVRQKNSS